MVSGSLENLPEEHGKSGRSQGRTTVFPNPLAMLGPLVQEPRSGRPLPSWRTITDPVTGVGI